MTSPTLMDHIIAIRQEVAALRQETHNHGEVIDAVGQAVGQLYQAHVEQTQINARNSSKPTSDFHDGDY